MIHCRQGWVPDNRMSSMKFWFYASIVTATMVATAMLQPVHSQQPRLQAVRSWAYVLQAIDPMEIARSPYDLVVVDYNENKVMRPGIVDIMRRKPDGSRRFVVAYLSIGE